MIADVQRNHFIALSLTIAIITAIKIYNFVFGFRHKQIGFLTQRWTHRQGRNGTHSDAAAQLSKRIANCVSRGEPRATSLSQRFIGGRSSAAKTFKQVAEKLLTCSLCILLRQPCSVAHSILQRYQYHNSNPNIDRTCIFISSLSH